MLNLERLIEFAQRKVGFEDNKLDPADAEVNEKGFTSQSWHAEMIYDCDRYITF